MLKIKERDVTPYSALKGLGIAASFFHILMLTKYFLVN